jgi:predicted secreted Zn-dependent protease
LKERLILALICLLVISFLSDCSNRAREEEAYGIKAQGLGELIAKQASACVSQSRAYMAVWEYAKVSEIDFEMAAAEMLGEETKQNKAMMVENKAMIDNLLEELRNPPVKFEESHNKLVELHEIYMQLHTLALKPSDDMEKHNEEVNRLAGQIMEKKKELDATFPMR